MNILKRALILVGALSYSLLGYSGIVTVLDTTSGNTSTYIVPNVYSYDNYGNMYEQDTSGVVYKIR